MCQLTANRCMQTKLMCSNSETFSVNKFGDHRISQTDVIGHKISKASRLAAEGSYGSN